MPGMDAQREDLWAKPGYTASFLQNWLSTSGSRDRETLYEVGQRVRANLFHVHIFDRRTYVHKGKEVPVEKFDYRALPGSLVG